MYCSILPTHDRRALNLSDSSLHVYHMFMSLYAKQLLGLDVQKCILTSF